MNSKEACIALNLTPGMGPARTALLVQTFGSPEAIFEHSPEELSSVKGISFELAEKILESAGQPLAEELDRIERGGVQIFTSSDPEYPPALRVIEDPPLCLYVCGQLTDLAAEHSVAIVGSRRATAYGMRMARHLSESAVFAGWSVVSGLAVGIDAAAHEAVVTMKGSTIAVLGGGLMNIQPRGHVQLARDIVDAGGAVVSEFPMLFYPTRHSFPMRNRIISALSTCTIVIEAGAHSGALITAATALDQGKTVFALPGNADSELSFGCNKLIKDGNAAMITSFEDVLADTSFLPGMGGKQHDLFSDSGAQEMQISGTHEELVFCSEADRQILDFLRSHSDSGFDAIVAGTGITASKLSGKLIAMEVAHRIVRSPSGTYRLFH